MSQRPEGSRGGRANPYYVGGQRYAQGGDLRSYRGTSRRGPPTPQVAPPPVVPPAFTNALYQLPPPTEWPTKIISYLIVDPLLALISFVLEVIVSPRTHRIILRLSVLSALVWTALGMAIAAYVGFYRAWVPDIGLSRTVWLQYGEDRAPYADISLHSLDPTIGIFAQDQAYDVHLDLIVPLSAANLDLGNFMVALELRSAQNATVHHISKPCIIVHEPSPVRAMNNLVFQLIRKAPAFILPTLSPPVQLMTIPLLSRAILEPARALHPFAASLPGGVVTAHVTVGRPDAYKYWMYGGGHGVGGVVPETGGLMKASASQDGYRSRGELQTHSASLRFDAHLTGLRYFMYHHSLASFLLFTSLFLAFELASAVSLWAVAAFYTSSITQPNLAVEENYTGRRYRGEYGRNTTTEGDSTPKPSGGDDEYDSETPLDESDDDDGQRLTPRDGSSRSQRQSMASLQARDSQEMYERRRAEMLRDEMEGRRMTAVDQPATSTLDDLELMQGRRVLDRLDEETEEDTDVHASENSAGWEDVGEEETEGGAASSARREEGPMTSASLRRRPYKDEDDAGPSMPRGESTIGGSSTSRASSVRSFGATSLGTGATSTFAPSRSQTAATPEIKQEEMDDDVDDETEGDDTERDTTESR